MPRITKEHAEKIAKKLKATVHTGRRRHEQACIYHEKRLIARFGIRRGSRRDLGHDHIPAAIRVSRRDAIDLALCPMTREQWLDVQAEKGEI